MVAIILCPFSKLSSHIYNTLKGVHNNFRIITKKKNVTFENKEIMLGMTEYSDDEELEKLLINVSKEYTVEKLISISERDIVRAAKLREKFNLEGHSLRSALLFKDKFLMKKKLLHSTINLPKFSKIENYEDLFKFVQKINKPFIVKPRNGTSSVGVKKFNEVDDIPLNFNFSNHIVEEYVEFDKMYSVDGVFFNNELLFCTAHEYSVSPFSMKSSDEWCVVEQLSKEKSVLNKLLTAQKEVCRIMPADSISYGFHSEFFYREKEDKLIFCETTSRLGGALIPDLVKEAFSIDLEMINIKAQLEILTEREINDVRKIDQKHKVASILVPKKNGVICKFPEIDNMNFPWVSQYIPCVKEGDIIDSRKNIIDVAAYIIVKNSNPDELHRNIEILKEIFTENEVYTE